MASGVFGGGLIFVVAALLWVAVLVPSWVRRREFRTAEQNALRLQRTLRVLAETAEVPTEVRVEATAREALAQERLLRTAQRQQDAERKAELSEARTKQFYAELRAQQIAKTLLRALPVERRDGDGDDDERHRGPQGGEDENAEGERAGASGLIFHWPALASGSRGRARSRSGRRRSSCADARRRPRSCWNRGRNPGRTCARPVPCARPPRPYGA